MLFSHSYTILKMCTIMEHDIAFILPWLTGSPLGFNEGNLGLTPQLASSFSDPNRPT